MLSVIIPVLNEARALPRTLQTCVALAQEMPDLPTEIIVVDGGSADTTEQIVRSAAETFAPVSWLEAPRGRGAQMNAGAAAAKGEHLLFLHADTLLPPGSFTAITGHLTNRDAGCFRHRFSPGPSLRSRLILRLISYLHNFRFRLTNVAYGDQALFMRRALFEEIGGFETTDLEDVWMGEAIRSRSRTDMLPLTLVTDARKFIEFGELRALGWVAQIQWDVIRRQRVRRQNFFQAIR